MKLKPILLAAVAALATALPVSARVEPETQQLMEMLENDGVVVMVNSSMCKRKPIGGAYVTYGDGSRSFIICPGKAWDAEDHSTVRHEMAHAIQHCVNLKRGTPRGTPTISNTAELMEYVRRAVPAEQIQFIQSAYDQEDWLVEYEANAVERTYTSAELMTIWNNLGCRQVFNA